MSRELMNRSTATSDNALTDAERDAFLTRKLVCRLATTRADGWSHVTPLWYVWEDGKFLLSLGDSRLHLANIRRDDHVTLCVDVDPRLDGSEQPVIGAVCFGIAELVEDQREVRRMNELIEVRYLGAISAEFEEVSWSETRTGVVVTPARWLDWELGKS